MVPPVTSTFWPRAGSVTAAGFDAMLNSRCALYVTGPGVPVMTKTPFCAGLFCALRRMNGEPPPPNTVTPFWTHGYDDGVTVHEVPGSGVPSWTMGMFVIAATGTVKSGARGNASDENCGV